MKLADLPTTGNTATLIKSGDTIHTGITHEVYIEGDKSWIKFEATTVVGEDETGDEATLRVIQYVNESVIEAVKTAVKTVEENK